MTKKIYKYFKVWFLMTRNSFVGVLNGRVAFMIFLVGKTIRFLFFIYFLYFLVSGATNLAGYTVKETIFFFLTFNLIDIVSQFLYREVYRFRPLVVSGGFDLVLIKPINALFRSLFGGTDPIDLVTIPPLLLAVYYVGRTFSPSLLDVIFYLILILNGLLIATAFHIFVLSLGIITLEIDHTIMIYRDVLALGKLPIDVYKEPVRSVITYLVPVGIMVTLPAKAFLGLFNFQTIAISVFIGLFGVFISYKFWKYAIKFYTSASS